MRQLIKVLLGLIAAAMVGCGGGGGGGGSSNTSGSFFITDDLSTGYDHVWVTIKQVSLGKVGGGSTVVYNNATGATVDLRSLRDANGRRFKFIAFNDHLSGQFDSVTVTLSENVVLFPTGASTGLNRVFEGAVAGSKTLSTTFAARAFGPGNDDLIIDFDLSQWNENGTQVTNAVIAAVAFDNGLNDDSRHERENYPGFVSGLEGTAPNQSFTLTRGNDSVVVQCDANTRIHRSGGDGNPVLANGQHVVVRGAFNVALNRLDAEKVRITGNNGNGDDEDEAYGSVSNLNAGAGTLDLSVTSVEGFMPVGDPIHVTSSPQTLYRNGAGTFVTKDEFFALLSPSVVIEVEGQYTPGTNTLLAKKMKIEDDEGDEDNGEVKGATSNVDAIAFTFKITATSFTGINVPQGSLISVVTTDSTTFRGLSGGDGAISRAQFFAALTGSPGQLAEVEGFWNGTTLTAFKCKLEDSIDD